VAGKAHLLQPQPGEVRRPDAHRGFSLERESLGGGLDEKQGRTAALELGCHQEELGLDTPYDQRLLAVEKEATVVAACGRTKREGVEQRMRLLDCQR
jgi:hypothetical protein